MAHKKSLDPEVIERERRVLDLRLLGITWEQIAKTVGYASAGAAWNAYQRALKRTIQEPADEVRNQEVERLNRLMTAHMQAALQGDVPATNTVLRIMERRARLLGLDVPIRQQVEVTTYDGDSLDAEVARLARLLDSSTPLQMDASVSETGADTF